MCGISGLISFSNIAEKNVAEVQQINDALIHRGPDGGAIYSDENVVLGHRRLSIIDLSNDADQPMTNVAGDLVIVFNGEIYNHEEIKKELVTEYQFKTDHSDTEVVLNAFREWGIDCVKRFKGMFAFSIYDKTNNEVYLVRDRFGKKPFYYFKDQSSVYFSSEIQSLFKSGVVKKEINEEAIYHYLTFLTVNAPNTFFKDIHKIKAGHYIKVTANSSEEIQYWDIADHLNNQDENISEEQARKTTEALMEKSMKHRFVSDVPVSIALSGGLDSSLNLCYAKEMGIEVSAINLSFSKKGEFDESVIAKKYADELGINLHQITIDEKGFEDLIKEYLAIQKDLPIGDPNFCLLYEISKYARKIGSKVLLVGEGGDEIGGYPVYETILKEYNLYKKSPALAHITKSLIPSKSIRDKLDFIQKDKFISRRHFHGFSEALKKDFWKKELPKKNSNDVIYSYMFEIKH
ncbi:MAG: asparagine synthase (glutamine-hydrolyzing), partial [Vicingaceae bacterium]|nr:asparagine synthase (glutamine-hydrolyzing) [Vicingaceae bacterium]